MSDSPVTQIDAEMAAAVSEIVDTMLLSSYTARFNLVLKLSTQEVDDEPTLFQKKDGTVYSLLYPFTGVKVRLSPSDQEETKASGYLSGNLLSALTAMSSLREQPILRLGTTKDSQDYYNSLSTRFHAAMTKVFTDDVPQVTTLTELTQDYSEESSVDMFMIDCFLQFSVNSTQGYENLEKWINKLMVNSGKFPKNVPFRFVVAIPADDAPLLMNGLGKSMLDAGFSYDHTAGEAPPMPLQRDNARAFFGRYGDVMIPHMLFSITF